MCALNDARSVPQASDLIILNENCRSIKNKIDQFAMLVATAIPHVNHWHGVSLASQFNTWSSCPVQRSDRDTQGQGIFVLTDSSLQSGALRSNTTQNPYGAILI